MPPLFLRSVIFTKKTSKPLSNLYKWRRLLSVGHKPNGNLQKSNKNFLNNPTATFITVWIINYYSHSMEVIIEEIVSQQWLFILFADWYAVYFLSRNTERLPIIWKMIPFQYELLQWEGWNRDAGFWTYRSYRSISGQFIAALFHARGCRVCFRPPLFAFVCQRP